jgi:hypothetical protein
MEFGIGGDYEKALMSEAKIQIKLRKLSKSKNHQGGKIMSE